MQNIVELANTRINKNLLCGVAILLFCFFSFTLPIQMRGIPSGFDMVTVMRFASAFQDAFAAGDALPGWENNNFDKGSVGVRFYPPLSIALLSLSQLVTKDWFIAILANLSFWMVLGCVGMFFFMRDWMSPGHALLAAITYGIVPQHLADLFQSFLFAQFAAWGLLPFCFMFVTRICRGGTWVDAFCFAASYSLLILTHIPTTIIVSICLPIYVLLLIDWSQIKAISIKLSSALGLTLLATAFRWLILVREVSWLAHNGPEHYGSGYYNFDLWLFPSVLGEKAVRLVIESGWLSDISTVLTALFIVPAVFYLFRRSVKGPECKMLVASLVTACFAFFMLSRASFYVWDNVVLLQKIQFPTRWLSVFSMFCVVLFFLTLSGAMAKYEKFSRKTFYPALGFVLFVALFGLTQMIIPSDPIPRKDFGKVEAKMESEPQWKGWWPLWAKGEAFENLARVTSDDRLVEITTWTNNSKQFVVQPGNATEVKLGLFYYPHWKATVNGESVSVGKDSNGLLLVPVSGELARVDVSYQELFAYRLANWVSALTWLLPITIFGFVAIRSFRLAEVKPLLKGQFDYS